MCLTEEYAISALTSVCRTQINPANTPPTKEIDKIKLAVFIFKRINLEAARKMPYLPNFSKIPARTMDPATGAST